MSNKSPESQLKEALSILGEFKASAEALKANAESTTLTDRLKKIEDSHTEAYKKMMDMEAVLKQFHDDVKAKFDIIEKKNADIYVDKSNDAAKDIQDSEHEIQKIEEAQESAKEAEKVVEGEAKAENVVDGVNPTVVKGQPNPADEGKPTAPILKPETSKASDVEMKKEEVVEAKKEAADAPNAEPNHVIENDGKTKIEKNDAFDVKADVVVIKDGEEEEGEDEEESSEDSEESTEDASKVAKKNKAKLPKAPKVALASNTEIEAVATVSKMKAEFESLLARIERMESAEKSAEAKVAKTIASLGIEPVASTVEGGEKIAKSAEDIVKTWESIKEPKAQRAFYLQHEDIIRAGAFGKVRKAF